jgi:dTDP-glucose pyrophosphorylase
MWGIVPAAGAGTRMQPLAFSKELLPVGSTRDGDGERPRGERVSGGPDAAGRSGPHLLRHRSGKSDILEYYSARGPAAGICYTVQPHPIGLCDAIFRGKPVIGLDDHVIVGLPDTIWLPEDALCALGDEALSFLLFPVDAPERFDVVITDHRGRVREIQVNSPTPARAGSGESSSSRGRPCMSCTRCGSRAIAATSTSARS